MVLSSLRELHEPLVFNIGLDSGMAPPPVPNTSAKDTLGQQPSHDGIHGWERLTTLGVCSRESSKCSRARSTPQTKELANAIRPGGHRYVLGDKGKDEVGSMRPSALPVEEGWTAILPRHC